MSSASPASASPSFEAACAFLYNHPETNMLFAIRAINRTEELPIRLANYDAHKAAVSDDGETTIGSLFVSAGIRERISITGFSSHQGQAIWGYASAASHCFDAVSVSGL
jgi:hypothetical protein